MDREDQALLWITVAEIRERNGDLEGAQRARDSSATMLYNAKIVSARRVRYGW